MNYSDLVIDQDISYKYIEILHFVNKYIYFCVKIYKMSIKMKISHILILIYVFCMQISKLLYCLLETMLL